MSIAALSNAGSTQLLQASNLSGFQQAVQTLGRSLNSGNLSAAQTAFKQLQQLNGNQAKLGGTANTQLTSDLTALGDTLKSGTNAAAKTAFAAVQKDLTTTNANAISAAANAASQIAQQIDAVIGVANGFYSTGSLLSASSSTPDIAAQTTSLLSGVYGDHSKTSAGSATTGKSLSVLA